MLRTAVRRSYDPRAPITGRHLVGGSRVPRMCVCPGLHLDRYVFRRIEYNTWLVGRRYHTGVAGAGQGKRWETAFLPPHLRFTKPYPTPH